MNSASEDRYAIRSVERALDIVQCVTAQNGELGVDEITARVGLPKSTVFRLLATLVSRRFLDRDPERQTYRLGTMALSVGARALGDLDIRGAARPHLEQLVRATSETVHLSVLSGDSALCIDKIDSPRSVRMSSYVGFRDPLYCSGVGKVLLAFADEAARRALIAGMVLEPRTARTITDKAELEAQLAHIRAEGVAIDSEEIEEGLGCVAAPIRDHSGKVVASLSLSGPTTRVSEETLPAIIAAVRACAAAISHDLGSSGHRPT